MKYFKKSMELNCDVNIVFNWHTRSGALERLNPPWEKVKIFCQEGIYEGSVTKMKVYEGVIGIIWISKHIIFIKNKLFVDEQIKGPFKIWIHSHIFKKTEIDKCKVTDQIKYKMKFKPISNLAEKRIDNKINKMFRYRHRILKQDIYFLKKYNLNKKNIAISGSSGLLGRYLTNFLSTQGHNVVPIVRRNKTNNNIIFDYENKTLSSCLSCSDVVIHFAGEPIGNGRWSKSKKEKIMKSRVEGTHFIAKQLANLKSPPKLLICASAIGYYGNRGDEILFEESKSGNDYISEVCNEWEKAAQPAADKGIRVVFLRIGVVLTPQGGALKKFLLPFKLGLGGHLGNGKQWMSWVLPDDVAGAVLHIIANDKIYGALNLVSPSPVRHSDFSKILAKVLNRPNVFNIPKKIVEMVFGQMGKELLLSSTRVMPDKLMKHGYDFMYPDLEKALQHITGNYE